MPASLQRDLSLRIVMLTIPVMLALCTIDLVYESDAAEVSLFLCISACGYLLHRLWRRQHSVMRQSEVAEQRNALFAAAIESTPAGIVIADATKPGSPIIFVNKSFTTITGYGAEEVMGRSCSFLQGIHTSKDSRQEISDALKTRQPIQVTILNYRKDQTPFWNELRISPLFDHDGKLTNFIALQNDVTAIHNTQQALQIAKEEAERATTIKSNFMAMMSHEIRTPINGILGTLSLLNEMPLQGEAQQLAHTAHDSASALLTIVNDMLDFSKIEAGKLSLEMTDFMLDELVQSCLELMQPTANSKKIALKLVLDSNLPRHVAADPTRIKQVLLNLISNAVKFTEQGSVTVKISNLLGNSSSEAEEAIVRFEVIDTGIGMSQDGMTRIFTEFNQLDPTIARRYGGTGLGLAICKRLIGMMHGEIDVESRLGEGSKFWFVLPLKVVSGPLHAKPAVQPAVIGMSGARILIVEDNATNQLVLTKTLERLGYACAVADNGAIALEKIQSNHYDLVFMDVSMPVMDGLTATRKIRELGGIFAELPVLAMTAQSMLGDRERCLAAGMNDYLSKPINREALQQALQHWIKPRDAAPAAAMEPALLDAPANDQINWQVLQQMADDVGRDSIDRLLGIFEQDMARRANILKTALQSEDWETLQHESHTLKSSCASCGLTGLARQMQDIEAALIEGNTSQARSHAASVDQMVSAAQTALKQARQYYQGESRP